MFYIYFFFLPLLISLLLTPLVRYFSLKYEYIDYPQKDRWNDRPVAKLGGIAVFAALLLPSLVFFGSSISMESILLNPKIPEVGLLISMTLIFLLGLIDDIYNLKPQSKFIGQIVITAIVIFFGVRMILLPYPVAIPLTFLWIIGITNAFNLIDNMDGLSVGTALISSVVLFTFSFINHDFYFATLGLIMAGATIGFLVFNFHPASIFMGDSGSMTLGFFLACITLMGTWQHASSLLITMLVPAIVLAVPIFDTAFVSLVRTFNGRSVSVGGKDHTSHRLVALGLSERNAVLVFFVISMIFGGVAIAGVWFNMFLTLVVILLAIILLFFFGVFLGQVNIYEYINKGDEEYVDSENMTFLKNFLFNKKRVAEVIIDLLLICVAYMSAYLLRYGGEISSGNLELIKDSLPIIIAIKFFYFYIFNLYKSEWEYAGLENSITIFKATTLSTLTIMGCLIFTTRFAGYSRAVFITDWLLTFTLLLGSKFSFRIFKEHIFRGNSSRN